MRSLLRNWSPLQLLWLIGISNAIATLTIFKLAIDKWHSRNHPIQFLPAFVLVIATFVGSFSGESALQHGIKSELWSDAQWAVPRRLLSHPVLWVWIGAVAVFILLYGILDLGGALVTLILPVGLSLIRITSLDRNRRQQTGENLSPRLHLSPGEPLQSRNWGR